MSPSSNSVTSVRMRSRRRGGPAPLTNSGCGSGDCGGRRQDARHLPSGLSRPRRPVQGRCPQASGHMHRRRGLKHGLSVLHLECAYRLFCAAFRHPTTGRGKRIDSCPSVPPSPNNFSVTLLHHKLEGRTSPTATAVTLWPVLRISSASLARRLRPEKRLGSGGGARAWRLCLRGNECVCGLRSDGRRGQFSGLWAPWRR